VAAASRERVPTAVDGALGAAEKFEFQIKNKKHSKYTLQSQGLYPGIPRHQLRI
jgi:hypothetical protein